MKRFVVAVMLCLTWGVLIQAMMALRFELPPTDWTRGQKLGYWCGQLILPLLLIALYGAATCIILARI